MRTSIRPYSISRRTDEPQSRTHTQTEKKGEHGRDSERLWLAKEKTEKKRRNRKLVRWSVSKAKGVT